MGGRRRQEEAERADGALGATCEEERAARRRWAMPPSLPPSPSLPAMGREHKLGVIALTHSLPLSAADCYLPACPPACRATRMAEAPPSHTGLNTLASSSHARSLVILAANAEIDAGRFMCAEGEVDTSSDLNPPIQS